MPIFTFREPGWSPMQEMERLQRRMGRLFGETFGPGMTW